MAIEGDAPTPKNYKQQRYSKLVDLGFSVDWIEQETLRRPSLWVRPEQTVSFLRSRGFDNPIKLITAFPPILSSAFDIIDAKIAGLKDRGFDNPIKLIRAFPPIIGYTFDNIDRKLRLLQLLHGNRAAAISAASSRPLLLGLKWRRILYAVRATNLATMPSFITMNPRLMAVAIGKANSTSPKEIRRTAMDLKSADADLSTLLDEFMRDGRLPPKLVRALSRI